MKNLFYLSFLLSTVLSFGQERTISGNVIAKEDGFPLPLVTVMIKNTQKGTQTDLDGNYSIAATPNDTLVFSYVGYLEQKIRADKEKINVQLREDLPIEIVRGYPVPIIRPKKEEAVTIPLTKKEIRKLKRELQKKTN